MSESANKVLKLKTPRILFSGIEIDDSAVIAAYQATLKLLSAGSTVCCAVYGPHFNMAKIFSDLTGRYTPILDPRLMDIDQMKSELMRSSLGADIQIIISPHSFFESPELGNFKASPAALAIKSKTATYLCASSMRLSNGVVPALKGFASFADNLILAGIVVLNSFKSKLVTLYPKKTSDHFSNTIQGFFPEVDIVILDQEKNLKILYGIDHYQVFDQEFLDEMTRMQNKNPHEGFNASHLNKNAYLSQETSLQHFSSTPQRLDLKLAVAMDAGFSLLCSNNLVMLSYLGVQVVYFSPLIDKQIPEGVDGVYLPGLKIGKYLNALHESGFVGEMKSYIKNGNLAYIEGSAVLLFSPTASQEALNDNSEFQIEANLNPETRDVKVEHARIFDYNILGDREVPLSFIESSQLKIKESFANKSFIKTEKGHPAFFSPTANSIVTSLYLNFSTNPLLALNFIQAMKGMKELRK